MGSWPKDVGIIAMELSFPAVYVDQTELEEHDGVSAGKYTVGLGQEKMGFCSDREDINSLCLTVVHKLMENYNVPYSSVGRLEVGTETVIDKSKSVKTVLMQLFEPHGVFDVEGIDTTNACYGGTAALFNAVSWIESSAWDGRFAVVVAADIAVYAEGSARPTGGAGAVAMLVGPNAPLIFDRGLRASYMRHTYDFYKPDLSSEYPVVDGKLSIQCYLNALDNCYRKYLDKLTKQNPDAPADLRHFDSVLFHSPYCKLVQKSLARLALNDFTRNPVTHPELKNFENVKLEGSYFDKDVERAFLNHTKATFEEKTKPSLLIASQVGNTYTASLYGSLGSLLISKHISKLAGNKVGLFSYGSGLASSMFSISIAGDYSENSPLHKLVTKLKQVKVLLEKREKVSPEKFTAVLEQREKYCHKGPYQPIGSVDNFFPGTYYLTKIDERHRRFYERVSNTTMNGVI